MIIGVELDVAIIYEGSIVKFVPELKSSLSIE